MTVIGIDVSKAKLDCFWLKDAVLRTGKVKVFKNAPDEFPTLIKWMITQTGETPDKLHVRLPATGIYHEALAHALYAAGTQVSVVNPAHLRDYAKSLGTRTKTDKRDSVVLALFAARENRRLWRPEPVEIRTLKALLARYEAVKQDRQRESNRLEKAEITQVSEVVLVSIHTVLAELKKEQARLEKHIRQHIDQHPDLIRDRRLLESIPGVGPVISQLMMAVIRSRTFTSAAKSRRLPGIGAGATRIRLQCARAFPSLENRRRLGESEAVYGRRGCYQTQPGYQTPIRTLAEEGKIEDVGPGCRHAQVCAYLFWCAETPNGLSSANRLSAICA